METKKTLNNIISVNTGSVTYKMEYDELSEIERWVEHTPKCDKRKLSWKE
jgi:hypothetical protein